MSPEKIYKMFGNKLVGNKLMKLHVCETLSLMPEEIIEFVTVNCWFMASMEDAYAFTFTGSDLRENHLIFLSDELLNQDESQIKYTIAHEIGHVVLGHRNSVFVRQGKNEIQAQEKEADEFARKFV
jgi:Zn-dependent peptidase ImmA (M78 family)